MENKEQTAVDWLVSLLNKDGFSPVLTDEEIWKAKQMEKDQIIKAYSEAEDNCDFLIDEHKWNRYYAEKYYFQKYGG